MAKMVGLSRKLKLPWPVSYTHLDVYKRQGYTKGKDEGKLRIIVK